MRDPFDRNRNFETNIIYYLGAGASANAIPLVSEMSNALNKFKNFIEKEYESRNFLDKKGFKKQNITETDFKDFCLRYIPIIASSPSLDTYAKKLWDEDSISEYDHYKVFISILFNFFHFFDTKRHSEYALPNKLEGRYENLIRSINVTNPYQTSLKRIIPASFKFLSWNYDFQFESTLSRFESPNSLRL